MICNLTSDVSGSMSRTQASLVASSSLLLPGTNARAAAAGSSLGTFSRAMLGSAASCEWHNSRLRAHSSIYADTGDCAHPDITLSLDGHLAVEAKLQLLAAQLLPIIRVCLR